VAAASATARAFTNNVNDTAFNVTVIGLAGTSATVMTTDSAWSIVRSQDVVGSTGTVVMPVDVAQERHRDAHDHATTPFADRTVDTSMLTTST
jgi:hypothetical protein